MANLKQIKRRIKSARNIRKITKTMKMVAVAKVQKAKRLEAANTRFVAELANLVGDIQSDGDLNALMAELPWCQVRPQVKTQWFILLSSDRGLCGSYNSGLLKDFVLRYQQDLKAGIQSQVIAVGKKAILACKKNNIPLQNSFTPLPQNPSSAMAKSVADAVMVTFAKAGVDRVLLCFNRYVSMVKSERAFQNLLPVQALPSRSSGVKTHWNIEPSAQSVLQSLLPLLVESQIYYALLSASASEHAARMLAMSSATDSASEMIQSLNLKYNKARQAAITKEILEIVGGAKALKKN